MQLKRLIILMVAAVFVFIGIVFAQEQVSPKKFDKPKTEKGNPVMVMETTMGTIELKLYPKDAPKTVENFEGLAKKGYYNGIIFHRVIDGFMIQGGDPTGTGTGGKSIYGKNFEDEISSNLKFDRAGLLAMANAGPNTNGSQFFVTLAPTLWLNGNHTIFGEVVSGMDIVKAIGKVQTTKPGDKPVTAVVMKKVYLKGSEKENTPKKPQGKK